MPVDAEHAPSLGSTNTQIPLEACELIPKALQKPGRGGFTSAVRCIHSSRRLWRLPKRGRHGGLRCALHDTGDATTYLSWRNVAKSLLPNDCLPGTVSANVIKLIPNVENPPTHSRLDIPLFFPASLHVAEMRKKMEFLEERVETKTQMLAATEVRLKEARERIDFLEKRKPTPIVAKDAKAAELLAAADLKVVQAEARLTALQAATDKTVSLAKQQCEKELNAMRAELVTLRTTCTRLEAVLKTEVRRTQLTQEQFADVQLRLTEERQRRIQDGQAHAVERTALLNQCEATQAELRQEKNNSAGISAQNDVLRSEISQLERQLDSKDAALLHNAKQLAADYEKRIKEVRDRCRFLEDELSASSLAASQVALLQSALAEATRRADEQTVALNQLRHNHAKLEQEKVSLLLKIESLESQVKDASAVAAVKMELDAKLRAAKTAMDDLKRRTQTNEDEFQRKLEAANSLTADLRRRLETAQTAADMTNAELTAALGRTEQDKSTLQAEVQSLSHSVQRLTAELEIAQSQSRHASSQEQAANDFAKQLQEDLAATTVKLEQSANEVQTLKSEASRLTRELVERADAEKQLTTVRQQLRTVQEQLRHQLEENAIVLKERNDLREQLARTLEKAAVHATPASEAVPQEDLDKLRDEIADLSARLKEYEDIELEPFGRSWIEQFADVLNLGGKKEPDAADVKSAYEESQKRLQKAAKVIATQRKRLETLEGGSQRRNVLDDLVSNFVPKIAASDAKLAEGSAVVSSLEIVRRLLSTYGKAESVVRADGSNATLSDLTAALKDLETVFATLVSRLEAEKRSLELAKADLEDAAKTLRNQFGDLEKRLESNAHTSQNALTQLGREVDEADAEIRRLTAELAQSKETVAELQSALQQAEDRATELVSGEAPAEEQLMQLLKDTREEKARLQRQMETQQLETRAEVISLTNQRKELEEKLREAITTLTATEDEIRTLREGEEEQRRIKELLVSATKELVDVESSNEQLRSQVDQLRSSVVNLQQQLVEASQGQAVEQPQTRKEGEKRKKKVVRREKSEAAGNQTDDLGAAPTTTEVTTKAEDTVTPPAAEQPAVADGGILSWFTAGPPAGASSAPDATSQSAAPDAPGFLEALWGGGVGAAPALPMSEEPTAEPTSAEERPRSIGGETIDHPPQGGSEGGGWFW